MAVRNISWRQQHRALIQSLDQFLPMSSDSSDRQGPVLAYTRTTAGFAWNGGVFTDQLVGIRLAHDVHPIRSQYVCIRPSRRPYRPNSGTEGRPGRRHRFPRRRCSGLHSRDHHKLPSLSVWFHESEAQLLGLFQVSILHNIVHLLFGVAWLVLARTVSGARNYPVWGGVIYLVLFVYRLIVGQQSEANFVPVNPADDVLHLVLRVGMIALGLALTRRSRVVS
jgi:hypothetical protein